MKQFCSIILICSLSFACYAKDIKGKVSHSGKGLQGVVVSDGTNFTVTDAGGNYSFAADTAAEFVFIVTPSGYLPLCKQGIPVFYRAANGSNFDFELFKYGVSGGAYRMLAVGDPQPRGENAFTRLEKEAFADLRQMGKMCHDMNLPVFSIFLGDILYDNLELYPEMKELIHNIQMPVWPVIGNHDHNMAVTTDDDASAGLYRSHFGPTYYAFNAGADFYIVLDNILYNGVEDYEEGLDEKQLNWLRGYLRHVPKGSRIFVAMHAPVYFYRWKDYKMVMADEFVEALADYDVTVISGHTHIQYNYEINRNMREFNIASVGGAWWLWDIQYSRDGTPCGYQVFDSNSKGIRNFWKTVGYPEEYQFKVYPVGTVEGYEDAICVKVWNWDNRWKVEWYEDGQYKGQMQQFSTTDPDYANALQRGYALYGQKGGVSPIPDSYFFFSTVPSSNAKKVKITVTDGAGVQYSEELNLIHHSSYKHSFLLPKREHSGLCDL